MGVKPRALIALFSFKKNKEALRIAGEPLYLSALQSSFLSGILDRPDDRKNQGNDGQRISTAAIGRV
jgi:hypothetical protein